MLQVVPYEEEVAGQRMQVVEDQLSKAHYLLGEDFTAVDIVCGQVLTLAEVSSNTSAVCRKRSLEGYCCCQGYADSLQMPCLVKPLNVDDLGNA